MAAAVVLALIVAYPCSRFGIVGHYFGLVTLAVGEVVRLLLIAERDWTGGSLGLTLKTAGDASFLAIQYADKRVFYYGALVVWLGGLWVWHRLDRSMARAAMEAIGEDETAAASVGIHVPRFKLGITALSAALTALGGVAYAQYIAYVNPETLAGDRRLAPHRVRGRARRHVLAAGAHRRHRADDRALASTCGRRSGVKLIGMAETIYGLLLVLFIIFLPSGIYGSLRDLAPRPRRRAGAAPRPDGWPTVADVPRRARRRARRARSPSRSSTTAATCSAVYQEPVGDHWQLFCLLPLAKVEPSPYQRDLSPTHVKRLTEAVKKLDRFVDPIVALSPGPGVYWTPNGNHRRTVLQKLKADFVPADPRAQPEVALPDPRPQHREGAQPEGEVARGDPHVPRRSPRSSRRRREEDWAFQFESRALHHARPALRGEQALRGRRLRADPAPGRQVPEADAAQGRSPSARSAPSWCARPTRRSASWSRRSRSAASSTPT